MAILNNEQMASHSIIFYLLRPHPHERQWMMHDEQMAHIRNINDVVIWGEHLDGHLIR